MGIANNVTRMLDVKGIRYSTFELPGKKLSARELADRLDVEPERTFKTIVVVRTNRTKPMLVVIPASSEVDLKCVARAIGEKRVHLPTEREAERLTGLQAGGISPLALINKGFQVLIDESALKQNEIHISGGQRGLIIRLPVKDLIQLTQARVETVRG